MNTQQRTQHICIGDEMMSLKYPTIRQLTRAVDNLLSEKIMAAQAGDFWGWTLLSCTPAGPNFPRHTYLLLWERDDSPLAEDADELKSDEPDSQETEGCSDETSPQLVLSVGDKFLVNGVEFVVEQFAQGPGGSHLTVKQVTQAGGYPWHGLASYEGPRARSYPRFMGQYERYEQGRI